MLRPRARRPQHVGCSGRAPGAKLALEPERLVLVGAHALLGIERAELEHTHVVERLADARPPEADLLERRHDPHEESAAVEAQRLGLLDEAAALLAVVVERSPDLLAEEAVAEQVCGVHAELLALVALLLGEL